MPKRVRGHEPPRDTILLSHFTLLFRWENLRQGPCGGHARERGEAEPTVGDRTAVKPPLLEDFTGAAGDARPRWREAS